MTKLTLNDPHDT